MKHRLDTVVFLLRGDEILLGTKKRSLGAGYWNGPGGKVEPGETVEQAIVRECQEEIGVTLKQIEKVAIHDFYLLDDGEEVVMEAHAFISRDWEGEPTETDELAPRWFKIKDIPYDNMWQDDMVWLPFVLQGNKVRTKFTFDENNQVKTASLTVVDSLS